MSLGRIWHVALASGPAGYLRAGQAAAYQLAGRRTRGQRTATDHHAGDQARLAGPACLMSTSARPCLGKRVHNIRGFTTPDG
jgi:hypothetical protein